MDLRNDHKGRSKCICVKIVGHWQMLMVFAIGLLPLLGVRNQTRDPVRQFTEPFPGVDPGYVREFN